MTKAELQYGWEHEWGIKARFFLLQVLTGIGLGIGFALGQAVMSWM